MSTHPESWRNHTSRAHILAGRNSDENITFIPNGVWETVTEQKEYEYTLDGNGEVVGPGILVTYLINRITGEKKKKE